MSKSEKLIEVYKARTEMEAQVIKGLLESFGIPCTLKSNAAPSVHMFTMNGLAEVKVMVLDSQAGEAKELINNNDRKTSPPVPPSASGEGESKG